ncbi:hypothetical protein BJX76DRAFT_364746 [Aspergillus varians]
MIPIKCGVTVATRSSLTTALRTTTTRRLSSTLGSIRPESREHKVVVIGGGSAGLSISHQLLRSGHFKKNDIAVVDPATWHYYQPGLIDPKLKFYKQGVATITPDENQVTLDNGDKIGYGQLVSIKGLPDALANPDAPVSSIYGYDTCDKAFRNVQKLRQGTALFTQPAGVIKCAGAPQKAMWLALDHWRKAGLYKYAEQSPIKIEFATGLPTMFGVPKYSAKLDELRRERGVEGLFQHDLVSIDGNTATFGLAGGEKLVTRHFDFLHAVPTMGPHGFVKDSVLANEAGYVDVNPATMQHTKYDNVWSAGDASNLPTSKTAAAITSQAPVLVGNLLSTMEGKVPGATYDGYTSCPLTTQYGKVLLAEFKYGGVPKETFSWLGLDQETPQRVFYYMKKDFFPWVYFKYMVKGTWGGPSGWLK